MAGGVKWWWWATAAGVLWWFYPRKILGYSFSAPVKGAEIRAGWGDYRSPTRTHVGIDIYAAKGTPVRSSLAGTVIYVDTVGSTIEGKLVAVRSGELVIRYLHLDTVSARTGDTVARGQVVGTLGDTGNASAPHVHSDISATDTFLQRFIAKYGTPTNGYWRSTSNGTVIPAETLLPAETHTSRMRSGSAKFGVHVRG